MTSTETCQPVASKYSSHHSSSLTKLSGPFKHGAIGSRMLLYAFAMAFLSPLAARAGESVDSNNAVLSVTLLGITGTGGQQPDTLLQIMTVFSIFAVIGIFGQRCLRYFQKRRLRRPFHIWGLW